MFTFFFFWEKMCSHVTYDDMSVKKFLQINEGHAIKWPIVLEMKKMRIFTSMLLARRLWCTPIFVIQFFNFFQKLHFILFTKGCQMFKSGSQIKFAIRILSWECRNTCLWIFVTWFFEILSLPLYLKITCISQGMPDV